jgi:hypothetical protein
LEELGNGKGKLAKASEEGQGPRRAVEPMMMMIGKHYLKFNTVSSQMNILLPVTRVTSLLLLLFREIRIEFGPRRETTCLLLVTQYVPRSF